MPEMSRREILFQNMQVSSISNRGVLEYPFAVVVFSYVPELLLKLPLTNCGLAAFFNSIKYQEKIKKK